jgi:hypothetical protein
MLTGAWERIKGTPVAWFGVWLKSTIAHIELLVVVSSRFVTVVLTILADEGHWPAGNHRSMIRFGNPFVLCRQDGSVAYMESAWWELSSDYMASNPNYQVANQIGRMASNDASQQTPNTE